ncbi:hypothetical protein [Streptomyces mirabilis]
MILEQRHIRSAQQLDGEPRHRRQRRSGEASISNRSERRARGVAAKSRAGFPRTKT